MSACILVLDVDGKAVQDSVNIGKRSDGRELRSATLSSFGWNFKSGLFFMKLLAVFAIFSFSVFSERVSKVLQQENVTRAAKKLRTLRHLVGFTDLGDSFIMKKVFAIDV